MGEFRQWGDSVALLQELIRVPSVNPDGDPGTGLENQGEKRMADFVGGLLADCGALVSSDEVLPDRPNIHGLFPGWEGKPRLVFGPHLDTVGVGGMTVDPFGGELQDGRIYGRGACDTKGTMAAMLTALWEHRETIPTLPYGVEFVGFMAEETGQYGSRKFAADRAGEVAFALIGEPTEMQVVNKHKGCVWLELEATGQAAHASTPELGMNAIHQMAALVGRLDREFRPLLSDHGGEDPLLGKSTLNVGMIEGGTRTNIVAESCRLKVDMRTTPALEQAGGAQKLLTDWLATIPEGEGISMSALAEPAFSLDTDPEHPLVMKLAEIGEGLTVAPWFCDAAPLASEGIPSVAAGPGLIAQAHTADEWISVEQLEAGVEFYGAFLRTLPASTAAASTAST